ncbi:hypothetical protein [Pseudoclavibacter sp. VKM Ac-2888]|uniref:hypothetical protein n=1 Tax=Pseudoclavibacter sp. VKM Ac-2888 TaxID=2783830 RepID=UPI00188C0988|nr:hypothetical protein [Pseudoclavibacter sp. VKM Ac-2888]MBF4549207.1 hypothetical protein [Pseudoclavibacter sp. VKM Ac-2888]
MTQHSPAIPSSAIHVDELATFTPSFRMPHERLSRNEFAYDERTGKFELDEFAIWIMLESREVIARPLTADPRGWQKALRIAERVCAGETFCEGFTGWGERIIRGQAALSTTLQTSRDAFKCERPGCIHAGEWQMLAPHEDPKDACVCEATSTPLMAECCVNVSHEPGRGWVVNTEALCFVTPKEARQFATALQEAGQIAAVRNREAARASG